VLALAQGDQDAEGALLMLEELGELLPFELLTDPGRTRSSAFDWMTTYLIDSKGLVREAFPVRRGVSPPWDAVLARIDELAQE
jgi:hypothetical protein